MIYTITLNPSIDYYTTLETLRTGTMNATDNARFLPGGKGINVSIILNELNESHVTTGFLGGFTGAFIASQIGKLEHAKSQFVEINGITRLNVKLIIDHHETEINHTGPKLTEANIKSLMKKIDGLTKEDVVIISGSTPKHHEDLYVKLATFANSRQAHLVIDVPGEHFQDLMPFKPLLMKPNLSELEAHFKIKLHTDQDIIYYGKRIVDAGVENLIVSLGNKGSILISKQGIFKADPVPIDVQSTIGAGDSMVAAFTHQYIKDKHVEKAFKLAVAAASATAASPTLATKKEIDAIRSRVQIHRLS